MGGFFVWKARRANCAMLHSARSSHNLNRSYAVEQQLRCEALTTPDLIEFMVEMPLI